MFQEHILSSWILYFGDPQRYWECRSTTISESYQINDTWRSHNITCKTQFRTFCDGGGDTLKTFDDNNDHSNSNAPLITLLPYPLTSTPSTTTTTTTTGGIADNLTLTKLCRYYLTLLDSYTSTSLTYPSDRLITL